MKPKIMGFIGQQRIQQYKSFSQPSHQKTLENTIWGILNETNQWRVNPSDIASVLTS